MDIDRVLVTPPQHIHKHKNVSTKEHNTQPMRHRVFSLPSLNVNLRNLLDLTINLQVTEITEEHWHIMGGISKILTVGNYWTNYWADGRRRRREENRRRSGKQKHIEWGNLQNEDDLKDKQSRFHFQYCQSGSLKKKKKLPEINNYKFSKHYTIYQKTLENNHK